MSTEIRPAGESEPRAELAAFMPPPGRTVWLLLDQNAKYGILLRSTCTDGPVRRWVEDRWLVAEGRVLKATERTVFELSEAGFGEVARYREDGGANVHAKPILIPSEPERGVAYHPFPLPDASLTMAYSGEVEVGSETRRALSLHAVFGGQQRVQWMLEGFGEIWLGPPDDEPFRWAAGGWRDDGESFGGGVPEELRTGELPELPPIGQGVDPAADPFA